MEEASLNESAVKRVHAYQNLSLLKGDRAAWLGIFVLWGAGVANIIVARQAMWSLQPQEFDLVRALPMSYWAFLVLGTLAGVIALWQAQSEGAITSCVVGVAVLYGPCFLLGIYPAISGWDAYIHAFPARNILAGDGIPTTSPYAQQFPGPTMLLTLVAHVLGMEPVVVGVIVTIAAEVGLVLIFMGIARTILGLKASAWTALVILALTPAIATNEHFSQWLIAYVGTWGIFLLIAWTLKKEEVGWIEASACAMILGAAVIVSHPFLPIIATAFVFGFAVWSWRERLNKRQALRWLAITLAVGVLAWTIYAAITYLAEGVSYFRDVLLGTKDTLANWAPLSLTEVVTRASVLGKGLILLRWAAYVGIGVTALSGLLLPQQRKTVILLLWLTIVSSAAGLIGFTAEAPWLQRVLYFAPPLLALAAGVAVCGWVRKLQGVHRWQPVGVIAVAVGLVAGLLLWHPPTLIYSVRPLQAGFVIWPQETAMSKYVANTVPEKDVIGSDLETMIVYMYYKPTYAAYAHGISIGANLRARLNDNPLLFDGTWLIRSRRQEIMGVQAQDLDPTFWQSVDAKLVDVAERVYDNGFAVLYHHQ